jgi:hypothetical protein
MSDSTATCGKRFVPPATILVMRGSSYPQKSWADCLDCFAMGNWVIYNGCEVYSSCSVSFFPSRLRSKLQRFRPAPDRDHGIVLGRFSVPARPTASASFHKPRAGRPQFGDQIHDPSPSELSFVSNHAILSSLSGIRGGGRWSHPQVLFDCAAMVRRARSQNAALKLLRE